MSTTPIAQPLAALNATPAPARANPASAQPAQPFGQTLSREIAQRQAMPQQQPAAPANAKPGAPRPADKAPAPRVEQGAKPAEQASAPAPDAAAARPAAPANNNGNASAESGDKGASAASAASDDSAAAAAAAADSAAAAAARAELPLADMLALVASLTQPAQAAAAPVAADPAWSTLGASRAATVGAADPNAAADAALAAFSAPAMAAGRAATVDGAPTAPAVGALGLPAEPVLAQATQAAPQGDLRALLEGGMPRAAAAGGDSTQAQAGNTPVQTTALQTAAMPGDAVKLAPAARALPDSLTAVDSKAVEAAPLSAPLQQAALGLAQAANGANDKLSARVGTPAWDNQVGQKIVWMVAGKEQSATLTLNPPDLGPVQVVLNVTGENASVTFSSGQLEVRQALENAMPKLREMMDGSGISLGNASVNAGMPEQRQDQGERTGAAARGTVNGSAADANERLSARSPAQGGGVGLVDTFA
jgi:flagellar hook-length control protein FliK